MPLCTIYLLALHPTSPLPVQTFLTALRSTPLQPLIISRVIRWIILPTRLSADKLLAQNVHWDILLILPGTDPLPPALQNQVLHKWSVTAGVPSRLLQDFASKNEKLLHPEPGSTPRLKDREGKLATDSQHLELSAELQEWIEEFSLHGGKEGTGAVSMLNLLSFKPGLKDSYLKYGAAFAKSIGSSRGGNAKVVGTVVNVNGTAKIPEGKEGEGEGLWDEVALAHYPSLRHFAEMLGAEDYQEVNKRYRVPALRDTFILATSEIGIADIIGEERARL
jgi:hypothetical protein